MLARRLAFAALVTLGPAAVAASPGVEALDGAVFSGPTGTLPGALITNPASLLRMAPGWHLFVDSALDHDRITIERTTVTVDGTLHAGPRVQGSTTGAGGQLGAIFAWPDGMIAAAAALRPPDETLADQAALQYHSSEIRTRRIDWLSLAGGYRYGGSIHVALSATMADRRTTMRFARDTALEAGRDPARGVTSDCGGAPCGFENPLATEQWTLDVAPEVLDVSNLVLSTGVLLRLTGSTMIGVTWQRPWSLDPFERTGTVSVLGAPRDGAVERTGEASLFIRLPEVWRFGARAAVTPVWELVTEVRWRRFDDLGTYDIRTRGGDLADGAVPEFYPRARGLADAVAVEAGLEQVDMGQRLIGGVRIGADSGAVADDRMSATSPWGAELTAALGAQLRLGAWLVRAGYRVAYQPTITSSPSAFDPVDRLDCVDSGYDFDLPACATVRAGFGLPTADGRYGRWSQIAWLGLELQVR